MANRLTCLKSLARSIAIAVWLAAASKTAKSYALKSSTWSLSATKTPKILEPLNNGTSTSDLTPLEPGMCSGVLETSGVYWSFPVFSTKAHKPSSGWSRQPSGAFVQPALAIRTRSLVVVSIKNMPIWANPKDFCNACTVREHISASSSAANKDVLNSSKAFCRWLCFRSVKIERSRSMAMTNWLAIILSNRCSSKGNACETLLSRLITPIVFPDEFKGTQRPARILSPKNNASEFSLSKRMAWPFWTTWLTSLWPKEILDFSVFGDRPW